MAKKRSNENSEPLLFKKRVAQLTADMKAAYPDEQVSNMRYMTYLNKIRRPDAHSEILIEIPAYCEPELINTIEAALKTAYNPERIHFAVCYQDDDMETLEKLKAYPNLKVKHYSIVNAPGLCAARADCTAMIENETYVLHIDGHARFARFWDVSIIHMLLSTHDDRAIISNYAPNYIDDLNAPVDSLVFIKKVEPSSLITPYFFTDSTERLRFRSKQCTLSGKPERQPFMSGHFLFTWAWIDKEVPSDPFCYFVADEISMAVRFFTHGFNVYTPTMLFIYHLYYHGETPAEIEKKKSIKAWPNHTETEKRELRRMKTLFMTDDAVTEDLGQYGLGTVRTLAEFEQYAGIDFKKRTVKAFAFSPENGGYEAEHTPADEVLVPWVDYMPEYAPGCFHEQSKDKTILVMISCYRESHYLQEMIESFVAKAKNPNRLYFAISINDDDISKYMWLRKRQDCEFVFDTVENALGSHHALSKIDHLAKDYDYVLVTHSHMMAVQNWDEMLLEDHLQFGDKSIITSWNFGIADGDAANNVHGIAIMTVREICSSGAIALAQSVVSPGDKVYPTYLVNGQCVFGRSQFIADCPHDPDMVGLNCDTSYGLRLWTHGYDFYQKRGVLYHRYSDDMKHGTERMRLISDKADQLRVKVSDDRMKELVGIAPTKYFDLGQYGLGTVRSLAAYMQAFGIDFRKGTVTDRCALGYADGIYFTGKHVDLAKVRNYLKTEGISLHTYVSELQQKGCCYIFPPDFYIDGVNRL